MGKDPYSTFDARISDNDVYLHKRRRSPRVIDALRGGGMLLGSAAMSSLHLVMQAQPSDNVLLRIWRNVRSRAKRNLNWNTDQV
jgi:hypothetical protein